MSKQRRTADDFVRDMKAKAQQHAASGDIEHQTSEGQSEGRSAGSRTGRVAARLYAIRAMRPTTASR